MKLDAEELLKEIFVWARFEWWTNPIPRKDRLAGQNCGVLAMAV